MNDKVFLKRREERRILAGHLWVYSNEIDTDRSPLRQYEPGQSVEIFSHEEKWLGHGYINPHSLICVRIVTRQSRRRLDRELLVERIELALTHRQRLFPEPYYRLVFGESDGLPGLVVDRFSEYLVIQISTAGMENRIDDILAALDQIFAPKGVLLRNDSGIRELEGLARYKKTVIGEVPETVTVKENGLQFLAPIQTGQKTGWFFDQADNRAHIAGLVQGRRVLDVFSYVGAWGVSAAKLGAAEVVCIDSSAPAIELVKKNAELNQVSNVVTTRRGDAQEALKSARNAGEQWDVVILDPPAFVKRKKDLKKGALAYQRINQIAMELLSSDGVLVTCSCSYHLPRDQFFSTIQHAANKARRTARLFRQGHQSPDHPVYPAMQETVYLKAFYLSCVPRF